MGGGSSSTLDWRTGTPQLARTALRTPNPSLSGIHLRPPDRRRKSGEKGFHNSVSVTAFGR